MSIRRRSGYLIQFVFKLILEEVEDLKHVKGGAEGVSRDAVGGVVALLFSIIKEQEEEEEEL